MHSAPAHVRLLGGKGGEGDGTAGCALCTLSRLHSRCQGVGAASHGGRCGQRVAVERLPSQNHNLRGRSNTTQQHTATRMCAETVTGRDGTDDRLRISQVVWAKRVSHKPGWAESLGLLAVSQALPVRRLDEEEGVCVGGGG